MSSSASLDSFGGLSFQTPYTLSSGSSGSSTSGSPAGTESLATSIYSDSGVGSGQNMKRKCNLCDCTSATLHELPCLHNFCQGCYEANGGQLVDALECEPCNNDDITFTNGLTSGLLLEINATEPKSKEETEDRLSGDESKSECTSCTEPSKAVATCIDCKKFLCLNCEMAHQFMYCFYGHKVVHLTDSEVSSSQSIRFCPQHGTEFVKYVCRSCDMNMCKQCALADHVGDAHDVSMLDDASVRREEDALRTVSGWKAKASGHKKALESLDATPDGLLVHYHKAVREAHETFDFYMSTLEDRKQELLRQLKSVYSEKIVASQMMRQKAQDVIDEIHQACQLFQRISVQPDRVSEGFMVEKLVDSKFESLKSINLVANLQSNCILEFVSNYQAIQVGVKNTFGYIRSGSAGKMESYNEESVSRFVGEPLVAGPVSSSTIAEVILSDSSANLTANNSLKRYNAAETPVKSEKPGRSGYSKAVEPAVSSTSKLLPMAVPSSGHRHIRRQKMSYDCKFGEFGTLDGQFGEPSGVAVNGQDNIIVADTQNHRIQVFDLEGRFKFKFGASGQDDGSFSFPNRVAVDQTYNDIIVTERYPTCQIQIYNQYGMFIRKFGTEILSHPRGITVDNKGRIILVECKVMLVFIFDRQGTVLKKFGCSKHLAFPNGVAVNNREEIFISDNRSHCIKVFNYDGVFLRQIGGEGMTNYPIGVAIDSAGHVLVADNHNNFNLTIFTQQGQFLSAYESKAKHAQCYDMAVTDKGSVVLATKEYRLFVYNYTV
ncbi:unnamed protein product [Nesidiocoris tenuis]|uniref:B box-type domain-containing protein n=1 Tax=Nesidiocoris tenuis TaxID=355587 RepID=A0A6H5G332_9HEMI|nr:unnamed protein product [Nesidiocoris tenuis]